MKKTIPILLIALFFSINLLTLMDFPTVHSDEIWLKGLALEMKTSKNFWTTEPFYDLYPRVVHPFRWLYTSLQLLFMQLLGNSVWTMRLMSLIFSALSLFVFHKIIKKQSQKPFTPFFGMLLLAINIQFIYIAHIGRQDMLILLLALAGYLAMHKGKTLLAAGIVALSIGVHPNALILAAGLFAVAISQGITRKAPLVEAAKLFLYIAAAFSMYLFIGYSRNPNLLGEYLAFGATLGTDAPLTGRLEGFYWFWYKLYHQIGGTYDLMNIKLFLLLSASLFLWGLINAYSAVFRKKDFSTSPFAMLSGMLLAFIVIGRYNALSVVFIVPWVILLLVQFLESKPHANVTMTLLLLLMTFQTATALNEYDKARPYALEYPEMVQTLQSFVPPNAVVLGNLNALEITDNRLFYDIRNLAFLSENGQSIAQYIAERNITYIIWHEENDYILRNTPKWDFMYGNTRGIKALKEYIKEHGTLVGSFENPLYAMRISKYSGTYPWMTKVYKIKAR